jgi:hypothetical protein
LKACGCSSAAFSSSRAARCTLSSALPEPATISRSCRLYQLRRSGGKSPPRGRPLLPQCPACWLRRSHARRRDGTFRTRFVLENVHVRVNDH